MVKVSLEEYERAGNSFPRALFALCVKGTRNGEVVSLRFNLKPM
jgi:hypothetical protein